MSFKLAFKNIKKSLKDYSIYFFTLVIAVAIFYTFNSLDAQSSMLTLSSNKSDAAKGLVEIIGYLSVFVSFILGFLIIFSNNFIIKRRKKEIGLYLTLGMSKRQVSTILVLETFLVGIVSLVVGLGLGVILSQFVSIGTAKLFEADMSQFKFIFSSMSFLKTIVYFGIIFVLVMIFNVIILSKNKLIDLINASKKNEKVKIRNKYITLIAFILSIGFIGYAYYLLFDNALLAMDNRPLIMIVCGSIGTFLFFFSLSGFLLKIFEKTKRVYLKDLNLFVLKQVNNKVNTTVVSTTLICLMLLLTIGILSCSLSLANAFNSGVQENNLTDWTLITNTNTYIYNEDGSFKSIESFDLNKIISNELFKDVVKEYTVYEKLSSEEVVYEDLITAEGKQKLLDKYGSNGISFNRYVEFLKESDYVNMMKLYGRDYVDIKEGEFLILSNVDFITELYEDAYKQGKEIKINNQSLKPIGVEEIAIENSNTAANGGVVIVEDDVLEGMTSYSVTMIGNYKDDKNTETIDDQFSKMVFNDSGHYYRITTKREMMDASVGIKIIVTFIGLYLGIIFAICSATVLAIGQLSESSDNKDRYKILKQLGAPEKMIKKSLILQISVAFILPLAVAIIHAFFGLRQINMLIEVLANINLAKSILLTSLFVIFIYGGYFLATYLCSKKIVLE